MIHRKSWFDTAEARAAKRGNFSLIFKARDDDRQLDVANLSDEELDRLKDQLEDEIVYTDDGNRVRRSDLDKRQSPVTGAYARHLQELAMKRRKPRHALHDKIGTALGTGRLHKAIDQRKDTKSMETYSKVTDIPRVCEDIAKRGTTSLTEAEVTAMISAYAKHVHPDMPTAFEKVLTANETRLGRPSVWRCRSRKGCAQPISR
jgi:hypothetical protein